MDLIEEKLVLKNLITNEEYYLRIIPFLNENLFTSSSNKKMFKIISKYIEKFNKRPTISVLSVAITKISLNENEYNDINESFSYFKEQENIDLEWVIEATADWIKARKYYDAILDSADKYEKGQLDTELSSRIDDALSLTFSSDIGLEFSEPEKRWEIYTSPEEKIPFLLESFNTITNGGVSNGTLNMFMSNNTGGCKSLSLCHLSADYMRQGKNVLYISLEMAEDKVMERIDANIMNIEIDEMKKLPKSDYLELYKKASANITGRIIVKQFPTSMAHVGHIRFIIRELKLKKQFIPDVVVIDYLSIMSSMRLKAGEYGNSYGYIKAISEEVRGLAIENHIPVWSAIQSNRGGADAGNEIALTDISESYGVVFGNDLLLAIITSAELDAYNMLKIKQLKNRYADMNKQLLFNLNVSKPKMTLYDENSHISFGSSSQVQFEKDKQETAFLSRNRKTFDNLIY